MKPRYLVVAGIRRAEGTRVALRFKRAGDIVMWIVAIVLFVAVVGYLIDGIWMLLR
jgi:hypothetical protein